MTATKTLGRRKQNRSQVRSRSSSPFQSSTPMQDFVRAVDSSPPEIRGQWLGEYKKMSKTPDKTASTSYASALAELAANSERRDVRRQALDSLDDAESLSFVAENSRYLETREMARVKLTSMITDLPTLVELDDTSPFPEVRKAAKLQMVKSITDASVLGELASESRDLKIRDMAAVQKLKLEDDQEGLVQMALNSRFSEVRKEAESSITDSKMLEKLNFEKLCRYSPSSLRM